MLLLVKWLNASGVQLEPYSVLGLNHALIT